MGVQLPPRAQRRRVSTGRKSRWGPLSRVRAVFSCTGRLAHGRGRGPGGGRAHAVSGTGAPWGPPGEVLRGSPPVATPGLVRRPQDLRNGAPQVPLLPRGPPPVPPAPARYAGSIRMKAGRCRAVPQRPPGHSLLPSDAPLPRGRAQVPASPGGPVVRLSADRSGPVHGPRRGSRPRGTGGGERATGGARGPARAVGCGTPRPAAGQLLAGRRRAPFRRCPCRGRAEGCRGAAARVTVRLRVTVRPRGREQPGCARCRPWPSGGAQRGAARRGRRDRPPRWAPGRRDLVRAQVGEVSGVFHRAVSTGGDGPCRATVRSGHSSVGTTADGGRRSRTGEAAA